MYENQLLRKLCSITVVHDTQFGTHSSLDKLRDVLCVVLLQLEQLGQFITSNRSKRQALSNPTPALHQELVRSQKEIMSSTECICLCNVQPGAVKLVLCGHRMHLSCMHPVTSEDQFHCTRLYCNSRRFRTHSIFVCWGPLTFRTHEISVQPLIFNAKETVASHSYALNFRAKAAAYEIYENKKHTKYSGFTVKDNSGSGGCDSSSSTDEERKSTRTRNFRNGLRRLPLS